MSQIKATDVLQPAWIAVTKTTPEMRELAENILILHNKTKHTLMQLALLKGEKSKAGVKLCKKRKEKKKHSLESRENVPRIAKHEGCVEVILCLAPLM